MDSTKEFSLGQVVRSKAGRDKDAVFFIVKILDGEMVLVADGDLRKLDHPKKKKAKHLQPFHLVSDKIREKLENGGRLENIDLQKELEHAGLLNRV